MRNIVDRLEQIHDRTGFEIASRKTQLLRSVRHRKMGRDTAHKKKKRTFCSKPIFVRV